MKKLTEVQLNTTEGFFIQPIAYIQSCYRQCVGTPRQGALVPSSRASLTLTTNMSPEALDGLDEFSHLWIIFKFHLNTNTLKEAKAFKGSVKDSQKYTFKAKIVPPMLKEKKGILATRSPHRPNPIGVTLAKIVSVDKRSRRVYLCCCDLVDGTPVLDIKPYVPAYDTVLEYRVPHWIAETIETRNTVKVSDKVYEEVNMIEGELREYKNDGKSFMKGN
jgi:tRNA-Thr(GGU) m(6)t(6)A37 methyltransferase TsaA